MGKFLEKQGFSGHSSSFQPWSAQQQRSAMPVPQLSAHPNFELPFPQHGEDVIAYTLRCAAVLISPPKLDGEDEDTACEIVADAILNLYKPILARWQKWTLKRPRG